MIFQILFNSDEFKQIEIHHNPDKILVVPAHHNNSPI